MNAGMINETDFTSTYIVFPTHYGADLGWSVLLHTTLPVLLM